MDESVVCSRCGATFETQDDLIVHSIDTHAGTTSDRPAASSTDADDADEAALDGETVERLVAAVEAGSAPGSLSVHYRQRFLGLAGAAALAIVLALTYLHLRGIVGTAVYMFSLGTLFGLTLTYLQAFLQVSRR